MQTKELIVDEWNVFSHGVDPELEGKPIKEEKLCDCGDLVSRHDRHGCMARGCDCTKTLHKLTYQEKNL